jgi:peptidoglycan/xylan/chitin deacetylase (PgdA/CDA1 family)
MEHLSRENEVLSLEELVDCSARGFIPRRAVAVTFDDGYIDNFTTASPILEAFDIPATFFLTTERIDERHEFWWDTLERVFLCGDHLPLTIDIDWTSGPIHASTRTGEDRLQAHWTFYRALYACQPRDRDALLARVTAWSGLSLPVRPEHRPMTTDELRRFAHRPRHTIGGHGHAHVALPPHASDVQREELLRNKARLEDICGRRVRFFAYPYGDINPSAQTIAAELFDAAVSREREPLMAGANRHRVPRYTVKPSRLAEFSSLISRLAQPIV